MTDLLLSKAEEYTKLGYCITPMIMQDGTKIPPLGHKWTEFRYHIATPEELKKWFVDTPDVNGISIILDKSCMPIETDGAGESVFRQKIITQLSEEARRAILQTARTSSPHGEHRLLRVNPDDFPDGIREIKIDLSATGKDEHKEIQLLSQNKIYHDYGPGYSNVVGLDKAITISKEVAEEIVLVLTRFKKEFHAIKTVCDSIAPYYKEPNRNSLVFALAGFMHKGGVPAQLIKDTIDYLIEVTGNHDVERKARRKVIDETCSKEPNSDQVSGYQKLLDALSNKQEIIDEIQQVFGQLDYFANVRKKTKSNGYNIPQEILMQLYPHMYAVVGENPITLYLADTHDKKLKKAIIAAPKRGFGKGVNTSTTKKTSETETVTTQKTNLQLMVKDTIIDAIPVNVVINDNPLDEAKTYTITFMHKASRRPLTIGPGTVNQIIRELQNKGRYINEKDAVRALQSILVQYEDLEIAEINHRIPYGGYFWVDGEIKGYDVTQLPKWTIDDMLEGIKVLEEYYSRSKDKDTLITALKWGLVSPFSFVRKQMVSLGDWIPGLHLFGKTQTGKSSKGKFVCALWRLLGTKFERLNIVGFTATEARYCTTIGRNTYSVIMNEVSGLALDKNTGIVELVKHSTENTSSRSKYSSADRTSYIQELALSNCMFTSNGIPPRDEAYRIRNLPIAFEKDLSMTDDKKKEFNLWWDLDHKKLGVFGDFAARYIIENPKQLKELRWHEIGKRIIEEFYAQCGMEIPVWIDALNLSDVVEESNEVSFFEIRSFLEQSIIDSYRKDPIPLMRGSDGMPLPQPNEIGFQNKLDRCLTQRLIPYLRQTADGRIAITHDIIRELQNKKIANVITMQALANEIDGFEYRNLRSAIGKGMRVVVGAYEDFIRFLNVELKEEEQRADAEASES